MPSLKMGLLDLPCEILAIIINFLNAPKDPYDYVRKYQASTVCLCKTDQIRKNDPKNYPMWPEWKRDSLALGGVCKRLRTLAFDEVYLKKAEIDWTTGTLAGSWSALDAVSRNKVQILTLRGDCNDRSKRPLLQDYARLFPNLTKIEVVLIYPCLPDYQTQSRSVNGSSSKPSEQRQIKRPSFVPPSPAPIPMPSLSLAIHRAVQFHGTMQELYTKRIIREFIDCAQLNQANSPTLDSYHLSFAISETWEMRSRSTFWDKFAERMGKACRVPAKKVDVCFSLLIGGEMPKLLNALASAISTWPEEVQVVTFVLESKDFWIPVGLKKKLVVKENGEIELAPGYLPVKEDMNNLTELLRKARPTLRQFNLVVYVEARLHLEQSQKLLEIHHDLDRRINNPSSAVPSTSLCSEERCVTSPDPVLRVSQSAIDQLYKRRLDKEEMYGTYHSGEDFDPSAWEWDMHAPYEEWADRDAYEFGYSSIDEDD